MCTLSWAKSSVPIVFMELGTADWWYYAWLFCRLYLQRDEIDNPHKKKAKAVFKEDFAVELKFEDVNE